jgi:ElaB/YqjD/DUF883 family membrane-anchored ribosome-binding protein
MSSSPTFPGTNKDPMTKASDMANQAADTAANMGRQAMDRADQGRGTVAQGIERTADALRSGLPEGAAEYARPAADAMERAADYVRTHDLKSMGNDLTSTVRQHPGPSMIAAVAVGFLLGVVLRRDH